jgi:hypothetical protein
VNVPGVEGGDGLAPVDVRVGFAVGAETGDSVLADNSGLPSQAWWAQSSSTAAMAA